MVLVESGRESSGRSRDRRNFLYAGMVRVDEWRSPSRGWHIPCAQGWSWSRAGARAATDPGVEGISCAQEWFRWVNGDLHRVAENIPCARGWSFGSGIQAPTRKGGGLFCRLFSGGAAVRQVIKLSSFHHPALWKVFQVLGRFHGQGILGPKLFCAFMAK